MLKTYLTIAIRNLWRNRTFSLINIIGLTLGIAGAFLLFLWVSYMFSFDRFHSKIDRIYHVFTHQHLSNGNVETWWNLPYAAVGKIKNDVPEVEEVTQYNDNVSIRLKVGETSFYEQGMYAMPSFLTVFSFPLLAGDPKSALNQPNSIIISEKLLKKYFPSLANDPQSVLRKIIRIDNSKDFIITGVIANKPSNCNMTFEFILPIQNILLGASVTDNLWGDYAYRGYVLLRKDASLFQARKKIEPILAKYSPYADDSTTRSILFPHKDLNLYSRFENGVSIGGRISIVRIIASAGILLMFITCINFINLTLARSTIKMKEIGAHLVYGASGKDLFLRHFIEIFIQVFIASVLTGLLLLNLWPYYHSYTEVEINQVFNIREIAIAGYLVFVLVLVMASVYPSIKLSSFNPTDLFHKRLFKKFSLTTFNKVMVVVQVGISSVFIISGLFIFLQTRYLLTKELGLDISNVALTHLQGNMLENRQQIKSQLEQLEVVESISFSSQSPLNSQSSTTEPTWKDMGPKTTSFYIIQTDYDYIKTLNIKLLQGRDFSPQLKTDSANYLINETMYRVMGKKDVLGTEIEFWGNRGKVIGVVNDFHHYTIHEPIQPIIIKLGPWNTNETLISFSGKATNETLSKIEKILASYSNGNPIEFNWLKDEFQNTYTQDINHSILSAIITFLAIIISALGLLGITLFTLESRKKEMSIRKVTGASPLQIYSLVFKDFMTLVIIANLIAWPLAYYTMHVWLQNFAYKIDLLEHFWIFLVAGLGSVLIAGITIGIQTTKTAMENPVKNLKEK